MFQEQNQNYQQQQSGHSSSFSTPPLPTVTTTTTTTSNYPNEFNERNHQNHSTNSNQHTPQTFPRAPHQFSTPSSLTAETGSKLLYSTGMIPTTNTSTPFTTNMFNDSTIRANHNRSNLTRTPQPLPTPSGGVRMITPSRSPQVGRFNQSQKQKEKGVSEAILAHRSHYPARSGQFVTVVPPSDFPSDLPQNRSLPPSASTSSSHARRGTLMPLYPTLGGQLWAIAREYGLPSIGGLVIFLMDDGSGNPGPRVGEATWGELWGSYFQEDEDEEEDGSYEGEYGLTEDERIEMEIRSKEDWNLNSTSNISENGGVHLNAEEIGSVSVGSPSETNSSSASPDARLQRRYLSREPVDSNEGKARRAAALKEARMAEGRLEDGDSIASGDSQSTHGGSPQQSQLETSRSRSGISNQNARNPMPYAHERQQNQSNGYINGNGSNPRSTSNSYSQSHSQFYSQNSPASRSSSSRFNPNSSRDPRGLADRSNVSSRRGEVGNRSKGSNSTTHSTSRQSQTISRQSHRSNATTNGPASLPILGRIEWAVERNRAQGQWWNSWIDQAAQIQAQAQAQSQLQTRNQIYGTGRRAFNSSAEEGSHSSPNEEVDNSFNSSSKKEGVRRSLHLLNSSNSNLTPRSQIQKVSRDLQNVNLDSNRGSDPSNPLVSGLVSREGLSQLQTRDFSSKQIQQQPQTQTNGRASVGSEIQSTRSTNLSGSDDQVGSLSQPRSSMRFSMADSRAGAGMPDGEVDNRFAYSNRASSVLNDGYAFGAKSRSERGLSMMSNSTGAVQPLSATRESFGQDLIQRVREREGDLKEDKDPQQEEEDQFKGSDHSSNEVLLQREPENLSPQDQQVISSKQMEGILSSSDRESGLTPLMTKEPDSYDPQVSNQQSLQSQTLGVQGLGLRADMNQSSSRTHSVRSGGDSASYAGFSALMGYQGEGETDSVGMNGLSSAGGNGRDEFFRSNEEDQIGEQEREMEAASQNHGYAALEDDVEEEEGLPGTQQGKVEEMEEDGPGLPSNFKFNARAVDDDEGDEGMWRSLQDEQPSSIKDHLSGTGTGDYTHRQSFTPSFGDPFNPSNNPSLSPNSLTAHLSAADRERERERERTGTVSPEALAVHDWIQKTSAPALSNLNGIEDDEDQDEGVLPPEDDVADVVDLWARKVTSGEELPAIQEGNSYESSIHGAMAQKIQQMSAEQPVSTSQYRQNLTKPPSEDSPVEKNLASTSQVETSLLSPIALDIGSFSGPKSELNGTNSSSPQPPSSSDGSTDLRVDTSTQSPQSGEIVEESQNQASLTPQHLSLQKEEKKPSSLNLHAPPSPGARSMTSSTDSLGDLERALELLSPVASNTGESPTFQSLRIGKSKSSRGFEKMSSRDSLNAARTLSTSVTPSPRWLSKNKSLSSAKLSPRPASASAVGNRPVGNRPDIITSRVAASRIRTLAPASSMELNRLGESPKASRFTTSPQPDRDLSLPGYRFAEPENQNGGAEDGDGGIRTAYERVMNGRPLLNRKGSRNREIEEDGINSAPEEMNYDRVGEIERDSPVSVPDRSLEQEYATEVEGRFSKQSSPEIGFGGFGNYQNQDYPQIEDYSSAQAYPQNDEPLPRSKSQATSLSPSYSPTSSRIRAGRNSDSNAPTRSIPSSPSSSKHGSVQTKDENDETMVVHSERSSINRRPFGEGQLHPSPSHYSDFSGMNGSPHHELSAANSDTHHEEGPDFKMESRRQSGDLMTSTSQASMSETAIASSPSFNRSNGDQFKTLGEGSPSRGLEAQTAESREALIAQYLQHGRGSSVGSTENPTSIKRLLRGESFAESSINGGSSVQASPNIATPVLSPSKEEPSSPIHSHFQDRSPNALSQDQAQSTVPDQEAETDSERWSQDGSEYGGEGSHAGASPFTQTMRLSEVSAYSRSGFGPGDRGNKEEGKGNHTPTFAFDQSLVNDSRPTSYVPSSLGMHGEGIGSAEQSQSTSITSGSRSSPLTSISALPKADLEADGAGATRSDPILPASPEQSSKDFRSRASTGTLSVTESLDAMLNQIDGHNFSSLPERNLEGGLGRPLSGLTGEHRALGLNDYEEMDLSSMRKSTEEAVRSALSRDSNFVHERSISRSSTQESLTTPTSPRAFSQLGSGTPRKSSLDESRSTQNTSSVRTLSQSPHQRFKDLPPSPSLLPTFLNSPNLAMGSSSLNEANPLSPRSAGSGGFDLS